MLESLFASEHYQLSKKLIDASVLRHQALAGNLANINTPGYKRIDLQTDFSQLLTKASGTGDASRIAQVKPQLRLDETAYSRRPDGNNVSMDSELIMMSRNSLQFEMTSQQVSNSIKNLKYAITGRKT